MSPELKWAVGIFTAIVGAIWKWHKNRVKSFEKQLAQKDETIAKIVTAKDILIAEEKVVVTEKEQIIREMEKQWRADIRELRAGLEWEEDDEPS